MTAPKLKPSVPRYPCGRCGALYEEGKLQQAPSLEGGQTVAPWCPPCLHLYGGIAAHRAMLSALVDRALEAAKHEPPLQIQLGCWACLCGWLTNVRYSYDFKTHQFTWSPRLDLRYIKVSVSVDTSTGKVTNLED